MSREVLILGDSNVRRFYNKLGRQLKTLEFVQARDLDEVGQALQSINSNYWIVVFSFLSNLIVNAGEESQNKIDRINAISEMFNSLLADLSWVYTIYSFIT